jgi:hypothetical protein
MEINYLIVIAILLIVVILLFLLIKWNQKDKKKFIETMNKDHGEPESHPKEKI